MPSIYPFRNLESLNLGDHVCSFFNNEEEQKRQIVPFVRGGFAQKEMVIYLTHPKGVARILSILESAGFGKDLVAVSDGQNFDTPINIIVGPNLFSVEAIKGLQDALSFMTNNFLKRGFNGLRITSDMEWFGLVPGALDLVQSVEKKMNSFYPGRKIVGLCQYNTKFFSPALRSHLINVHPYILDGDQVLTNSSYVSPVDPTVNLDDSEALFNRQLEQMRSLKALEEKVTHLTGQISQLTSQLAQYQKLEDKIQTSHEENHTHEPHHSHHHHSTPEVVAP